MGVSATASPVALTFAVYATISGVFRGEVSHAPRLV